MCDNRSSDNKLRGMAKGIRSKVKRANRTEQRRVKVDPMIAKRTKELAEKLEKDINMKSGSRLMALARSFNQGKKAGKVSAKAIKGKKALATKANKSTRRTRSSSQEDAMDEDGDDDDDDDDEEEEEEEEEEEDKDKEVYDSGVKGGAYTHAGKGFATLNKKDDPTKALAARIKENALRKKVSEKKPKNTYGKEMVWFK